MSDYVPRGSHVCPLHDRPVFACQEAWIRRDLDEVRPCLDAAAEVYTEEPSCP